MKAESEKTARTEKALPLRSIAVVLICFNLAASARTLLLGLCVPVAVTEACENPAASKGAHACCVGSPDAARPGKAFSKATKSIPTCALCNLAQCPGQRYRTEHVALSLP